MNENPFVDELQMEHDFQMELFEWVINWCETAGNWGNGLILAQHAYDHLKDDEHIEMENFTVLKSAVMRPHLWRGSWEIHIKALESQKRLYETINQVH